MELSTFKTSCGCKANAECLRYFNAVEYSATKLLKTFYENIQLPFSACSPLKKGFKGLSGADVHGYACV